MGELHNASTLDVRVKSSLNVGEYVVQEQLLIVLVSDLVGSLEDWNTLIKLRPNDGEHYYRRASVMDSLAVLRVRY